MRASEDIVQERTALFRAHAQVTEQEPHEVHALALLWQTIMIGLELPVGHHASYITKRLVEKSQVRLILAPMFVFVAEIDILQNENQWPRAFNVITNSLECAAARAEPFFQYLAAFVFRECVRQLAEILAGEASHEEAGISENLTRCAVSRTGRTPLADFLHVFEDARANILQNEVWRLVCVWWISECEGRDLWT